MHSSLWISSVVDKLDGKIGDVCNWLVLLPCVVGDGNAMIRSPYDTSSNARLDVQRRMFAVIAMFGASYTPKSTPILPNRDSRARMGNCLLAECPFPVCVFLIHGKECERLAGHDSATATNQERAQGGMKSVTGLLKLSSMIDRMTETVGRSLYWLILVTVLISTLNAISRKFFNASSNAWLEMQWYLFSAIFLGCAGYALLRKEHIRIDIVAGHLSERANQRIALFGHIFFLVPLCLITLYESWPYFIESYRIGEVSSNAGGLIRWPAKLMIIIGFGLLLLQAISEIIKQIGVMRGVYVDPRTQPKTH